MIIIYDFRIEIVNFGYGVKKITETVFYMNFLNFITTYVLYLYKLFIYYLAFSYAI